MIVRTFKPRFAPMVREGIKKQTVRPFPKRLPRIGTELSLREWSGLPYRSPQRLLRESILTALNGILIEDRRLILFSHETTWVARKDAFAVADGFSNFAEMQEWFRTEHGPFPFLGLVYYWQK